MNLPDAPAVHFPGRTNTTRRDRVRRQIAIAAAQRRAHRCAACSSTKTNTPRAHPRCTARRSRVWLMVDAQSGWQNVVDQATQRFTAETHATVKVEYSSGPTVPAARHRVCRIRRARCGRAQATRHAPKYVFNGAFADIGQVEVRELQHRLTGLSDRARSTGKTYCVAVLRRRPGAHLPDHLLSKSGLTPPTTLRRPADRCGQAKADNWSRPELRGLLHARMPTGTRPCRGSYGQGARSPRRARTASGPVPSSSRARSTGLQQWADLDQTYSKGDPTKDEERPGRHLRPGPRRVPLRQRWEPARLQSAAQGPNDPNSAMVDTAVKDKSPRATAGCHRPVRACDVPRWFGHRDQRQDPEQALAQEWVKFFTGTAPPRRA